MKLTHHIHTGDYKDGRLLPAAFFRSTPYYIYNAEQTGQQIMTEYAGHCSSIDFENG